MLVDHKRETTEEIYSLRMVERFIANNYFQNWFTDDLIQTNHVDLDEYRHMDIAEYVLSLCDSDAKLQRCGEELLLFQERNLFDLLRYLKYLVDTLRANRMIWGVGRGSSVASYVLYLLGVHRIDSMFYDLDIHEFLR